MKFSLLINILCLCVTILLTGCTSATPDVINSLFSGSIGSFSVTDFTDGSHHVTSSNWFAGTTSTLSVSWSALPTASSYQISFKDSGGNNVCGSPIQNLPSNLLTYSFSTACLLAQNETYNLIVTANSSGLAPSTTPTFQFTVDRQPPAIAINTPIPTNTNSRTVTETFTITDTVSGIASTTCSVSSATPTPCSSPFTRTFAADGTYTLVITTTDNAGLSASTTVQNFTINTVAPALTITSPATATSFTNTQNQTISGACQSGLSVVITGDFTSSPLTLDCATGTYSQGLALSAGDGGKLISVSQTDAASNQTTQSITVLLDTAPPSVSITSSPPSFSNSSTATFVFAGTDTGSGIAGFSCQLDGSAYATCSSPMFYPITTQSTHIFNVRAIDNAGNFSIASYTWNSAFTAPNVVFGSTPPNITNQTGTTFIIIGSGAAPVANYFYSIDEGPYTQTADPTVNFSLLQGDHTFSAFVVDQAGNSSANTPVTYEWIIDTSPPTITFSAQPPAITSNTSPSVTFSASDNNGVASTQCQVNAGAFSACTAGQLSFSGLATGSYTINVQATDVAGNVGHAGVTFTIENPGTLQSFAANRLNTGAAVEAMVAQANGQIVIAGQSLSLCGTMSVSNICRLNSDGSVDTSFQPTVVGGVTSLAIDSNQNIYAAGTGLLCGSSGVNPSVCVISPTGAVTQLVTISGTVRTLAVDNAGKIFVGGNFSFCGLQTVSNMCLVSPSGTVISNYAGGTNGTVYSSVVSLVTNVLTVGGSFTACSGISRESVCRYTGSAVLDSTWDGSGGISGSTPVIYSILLDVTGSDVFLAGAIPQLIRRFAFSAGGAVDSTFNSPWTSDTSEVILSMALDSQNNLLVGGSVSYNGVNNVLRLTPTGNFDTAFKAGEGNGVDSFVNAILYLPTQNLYLIGGQFSHYNGTTANGLASVLP